MAHFPSVLGVVAFVVVALARAGGNLRGGIAKSVATTHSGNASREYLSISHGNGSNVGGMSDENLTVSRVVPVVDIAIPSPASSMLLQVATQSIKCQEYYRSPGGPFRKENIYNFGCEGSSNCCFYRGPSGGINFCDTCVGNAFLLQAGQPEVEPDDANGTSANESLNAQWFVPVPIVVMPSNAAPRMPGQIMPPIAPAAGPVVVPPVTLPGTLVPPSVPVIGPVVVPPVIMPGVPVVR